MHKLYRILTLIFILTSVLACNSNLKKKDVDGSWQISEITPEEGWEVLHIDKFYLDFSQDSMLLVHGGSTTSYFYRIIENKLVLNETIPYGTIVDKGENTMTIDLNNSKYSFYFEKR